MKRFAFALLLALPILTLAAGAYADCGGAHGASSDKVAQPAPPPPPPQPGQG